MPGKPGISNIRGVRPGLGNLQCESSALLSSSSMPSAHARPLQHAFHFHCISRWLKSRNVCPLDNREWELQKVGLLVLYPEVHQVRLMPCLYPLPFIVRKVDRPPVPQNSSSSSKVRHTMPKRAAASLYPPALHQLCRNP